MLCYQGRMLAIFLQTLPFFLIIGLGYGAGRTRFFSEEATAYLTKFVFYFALSAMLFRFSANLSLAEVIDWRFITAYLWGTGFVYILATLVSFARRLTIEEAAVEAQCAVIGNVGFLGIPMLLLLMGEAAIVPVMLVLAVDLIVFGSLIVILITGSRDGRMSLGILRTVGLGLLRNPMIVSIVLGLSWSALALPIPDPMNDFLSILGGAATPGALFDDLAIIRARRWSFDREERYDGMSCIGSAIFDEFGAPCAGVSISGPGIRFDETRISELGAAVVKAADDITRNSGGIIPDRA